MQIKFYFFFFLLNAFLCLAGQLRNINSLFYTECIYAPQGHKNMSNLTFHVQTEIIFMMYQPRYDIYLVLLSFTVALYCTIDYLSNGHLPLNQYGKYTKRLATNIAPPTKGILVEHQSQLYYFLDISTCPFLSSGFLRESMISGQ